MISTLFLLAFVPIQEVQRAPAREVVTARGVRVVREKPAHTEVTAWEARDVIQVKFHDDLLVRARLGTLDDFGTGALDDARDTLARFVGGRWRPEHTQAEDFLDGLVALARSNATGHLADIRLQFRFEVPEGVSAEEAIDALNALDCVEIAEPLTRPMPPPAVPPNFQDQQVYLGFAPKGLNHESAWTVPGGAGNLRRIADIEYEYDTTHVELGAVNTIMPAGATMLVNSFGLSGKNHGTAVLGEIKPIRDGIGVSGGSPAVAAYFVPADTDLGYSIPNAITAARTILGAGDVILIEQQTAGPNFNPPACCATNTCAPGVDCQLGLVASEWQLATYNAVRTAVMSGVIVVEAAGNGSQNLDAAAYNVGHAPFTPANDSGAFIVGAGASPNGSDNDRSRLGFSNYGGTLDLQGWGENVTTCGYGDLYAAEGQSAWYTSRFSGTSSASPMIAAACAQVSSAYLFGSGNNINPGGLKSLLQLTGSPQEAGAFPTTQRIGPRPNVSAALQAVTYSVGLRFCAGDGFGTNCPCGNNSPPSAWRGCQNSLGRGALLVASGVASIGGDSLILMGTEMAPASALYFQGTAQVNGGFGAVFGDGLRCVGGAVVRLGTVFNDPDGSSVMPRPGQQSISVRGQVAQPGTRHYQIWYRNAAAYCTPATFNLTNGVRIDWTN